MKSENSRNFHISENRLLFKPLFPIILISPSFFISLNSDMNLSNQISIIILMGGALLLFFLSWSFPIWSIPDVYDVHWFQAKSQLPHLNRDIFSGRDPLGTDDAVGLEKVSDIEGLIANISAAGAAGGGGKGEDDLKAMLMVHRHLEQQGGMDAIKGLCFVFLFGTFVSLILMASLPKSTRWLNSHSLVFHLVSLGSSIAVLAYLGSMHKSILSAYPKTTGSFGLAFHLFCGAFALTALSLLVMAADLIIRATKYDSFIINNTNDYGEWGEEGGLYGMKDNNFKRRMTLG